MGAQGLPTAKLATGSGSQTGTTSAINSTTNAWCASVEQYHYNEDGENKGEQPSNVIAQSVQANPDGRHLV